MSKFKRLPIPTKWKAGWDYAVDEAFATQVARQITAKSFDRFHRRLVNAFGACEDDCAAYLWNKTHPEKPRKYIEEWIGGHQ